jgi:hypothetical protein
MNMDESSIRALIEVGQAIFPMLSVLSALVGLWMIGSAGLLMWRAGSDHPQARQSGIAGPLLTKSLVGALFLQFSRSIEMTRELVGGAGAEVRAGIVEAAGPSAGSGFWGLVMAALFLWLTVIGALAMFRGFYLWHKAGAGDNQGGGGDHAWAALWHVLAGAIAINIGS